MLDASYLNKNFLKTGPKYYHSDVITVHGFVCTPPVFFFINLYMHIHMYILKKRNSICNVCEHFLCFYIFYNIVLNGHAEVVIRTMMIVNIYWKLNWLLDAGLRAFLPVLAHFIITEILHESLFNHFSHLD